MEMGYEHFQIVDCHGSPREMGRQYGEDARDAIRANLEWRQRRVAEHSARQYVEGTRVFLSQHAPAVLEELEGLAEGSGASIEALIIENAAGTPMSGECTSMAISAGTNGAVLGKNNDGVLDDRRWVLRRTRPTRGHPMVHFVSAGWLSGLDALNASGLANGHNSVGSLRERVRGSVEVRLWAYHLMQRCSTVDEFAEGLLSVPLNGKGFNIVVADAAGNASVIECAVPMVVQRGRGDPFVYATNHYITDELKDADARTPDQKRISEYRFGYLAWQNEVHQPGDKGDIERLLKSHEPWAPCRHGGAHKSHTLWSIIATPARRSLDVAFGAPCKCEYTRYEV